MDHKQAFAARLNSVLDEHKYPPKHQGRQKQLAAEFHVSPRTAANWLNGEKFPEEERIIQICLLFHLSRDWLMTGMGLKHPISEQEQHLIHCVRDLPPAGQEAVYRAAQATTAKPTNRAA